MCISFSVYVLKPVASQANVKILGELDRLLQRAAEQPPSGAQRRGLAQAISLWHYYCLSVRTLAAFPEGAN